MTAPSGPHTQPTTREELVRLVDDFDEYLLWRPGEKGHAAAHRTMCENVNRARAMLERVEPQPQESALEALAESHRILGALARSPDFRSISSPAMHNRIRAAVRANAAALAAQPPEPPQEPCEFCGDGPCVANCEDEDDPPPPVPGDTAAESAAEERAG